MDWLWGHLKTLTGSWFSTLYTKIPGLASRVLSGLGISMFSFQFVLPEIKSRLAPYFSGLTPKAYQYVVYLGVDKCIVVVLSAYAAKLVSNIVFGHKTS